MSFQSQPTAPINLSNEALDDHADPSEPPTPVNLSFDEPVVDPLLASSAEERPVPSEVDTLEIVNWACSTGCFLPLMGNCPFVPKMSNDDIIQNVEKLSQILQSKIEMKIQETKQESRVLNISVHVIKTTVGDYLVVQIHFNEDFSPMTAVLGVSNVSLFYTPDDIKFKLELILMQYGLCQERRIIAYLDLENYVLNEGVRRSKFNITVKGIPMLSINRVLAELLREHPVLSCVHLKCLRLISRISMQPGFKSLLRRKCTEKDGKLPCLKSFYIHTFFSLRYINITCLNRVSIK